MYDSVLTRIYQRNGIHGVIPSKSSSGNSDELYCPYNITRPEMKCRILTFSSLHEPEQWFSFFYNNIIRHFFLDRKKRLQKGGNTCLNFIYATRAEAVDDSYFQLGAKTARDL